MLSPLQLRLPSLVSRTPRLEAVPLASPEGSLSRLLSLPPRSKVSFVYCVLCMLINAIHIAGKRPPPPSNDEFEDEEPVPVPKPKKHRAVVSPSASPEPDVEHEFDFEPNGAQNTPDTSPPPRRRDKGQARRDVELVEDDREEEEYGPGDPEGEGEGDDEDAPSAFQDPERAAENLIQALDGVKEKQRSVSFDYMRIYALLILGIGISCSSRKLQGSSLAPYNPS